MAIQGKEAIGRSSCVSQLRGSHRRCPPHDSTQLYGVKLCQKLSLFNYVRKFVPKIFGNNVFSLKILKKKFIDAIKPKSAD